jgi:hypothetical protein
LHLKSLYITSQISLYYFWHPSWLFLPAFNCFSTLSIASHIRLPSLSHIFLLLLSSLSILSYISLSCFSHLPYLLLASLSVAYLSFLVASSVSFCCFLRFFLLLLTFASNPSRIFLSCFIHFLIYFSHNSLLFLTFLSGASCISFTFIFQLNSLLLIRSFASSIFNNWGFHRF